MADHVLAPPLTAEQCRDRARLIRYTAAAVKSALLRHDLLEMASEYEQFARGAERSRND
jgi:hypothetical protein